MKRTTSISTPALACFIIAALLAGIALHGWITPDQPPAQPPTSDTAPPAPEPVDRGPGPWGIDDGVPVGFAHTEAGAVAAAAAYVTTGQTLFDLAPTEVGTFIARYAAAETVDRQIADLSVQLDSLRDVLSIGTGRTRYVQGVLATRVDSYTPDRARIQVWAVGVLWRHGAADPQTGWTTSTSAAWSDGSGSTYPAP